MGGLIDFSPDQTQEEEMSCRHRWPRVSGVNGSDSVMGGGGGGVGVSGFFQIWTLLAFLC